MLKKVFSGILSLSAGLAVCVSPATATVIMDYGIESGAATAREWYLPNLKFAFDVETRDGTMALPDRAALPYTMFKGVDASPNGHCLEVSFKPGLAPPSWMQVWVNDHGTFKLAMISNIENGGYPTMRLWVHRNTGTSSLNWALYFFPEDGNTEFSGDIDVDVRRLEVTKAGCTTAQVGGVSMPGVTFPWVSFQGQNSNYTLTKGGF
jgi:hypothetical protein